MSLRKGGGGPNSNRDPMKKLVAVTLVALLALAFTAVSFGASADTPASSRSSSKSKSPAVRENASTQKRMSASRHSRRVARSRRHRRYYERFYTSSYAEDIAAGDITAGEDPVVRAAALDALGNMNGTVLALDADTGRILAMVNQKLALSEGAQPCSTIKLAVALAALREDVVTKDTEVRLGRRARVNLTQALAHSNNAYFEQVGRKLGFRKVSQYAHEFGLGELAGYNLAGEHLGVFPDSPPPARDGGVGRMCSYGEDISMTPLQLGALVAAMANGGSLYYLQHPATPEEVAAFQPKLKRQLDIAGLVPDVSEGMAAAVQYGTARSVRYNFSEEEVLGKTGTCSKDGTRFGWFASYVNSGRARLVVVVFLQGGRPTFGPKAAEIAGRIYRQLYDHSYFAAAAPAAPQSN